MIYVAPVIKTGMLKQVHDPAGGPAPRIGTSENNPAYSNMNGGPGAHDAGLLGHVQIAIDQPPVSYRSLRLSQGEHLRMRRSILQHFDLVISAADNFPGANHDRSNRNLVGLTSLHRQAQGFAHEEFIVVHFHRDAHNSIIADKATPSYRNLMNKLLARSRSGIIILAILSISLAAASATEQSTVDSCAVVIRQFRSMPETGIPRDILRDAKGVAVMSVVKAGFIFSGKLGRGVVVARNNEGWSGPSFIATGGAGWGFQIGAEVTDYVFILNNDAAVGVFSRGGNITLGADASIAAGPVGRTAAAGVARAAAIYSYSLSKGLFAGVSLEGAIIATQSGANARYYGEAIRGRQILAGEVKPPRGARVLYEALR